MKSHNKFLFTGFFVLLCLLPFTPMASADPLSEAIEKEFPKPDWMHGKIPDGIGIGCVGLQCDRSVEILFRNAPAEPQMVDFIKGGRINQQWIENSVKSYNSDKNAKIEIINFSVNKTGVAGYAVLYGCQSNGKKTFIAAQVYFSRGGTMIFTSQASKPNVAGEHLMRALEAFISVKK